MNKIEKYSLSRCGCNDYGYKSKNIEDVPVMIKQCI